MIIVEGADNSGKTTLINQLCEEFPGLVRTKSMGVQTDYDWWMGGLCQDPQHLKRAIYDRFLYSEYVYGPIMRDKIRLTIHQREVLQSMLLTMEPLVIHCKLIDRRDLFDDRDQVFEWSQNIEVAVGYEELFRNTGAVPYEAFAEGSLDAMKETILSYLTYMEAWEEERRSLRYGRGPMRNPRLMIVGQQFAKDNRWKVPFERSKSALILHNALRRVGFTMEEVWFTNAFKGDDVSYTTNSLSTLIQEIITVGPEEIVCLGNKASGLMGAAFEGKFTKMLHPGFFVRKSDREGAKNYYNEQFTRLMDDFRRKEFDYNEHKRRPS